jgi:cob(I)alamin adenosyltransferase
MLVTIAAMGEGFTWETQDRERDIAAAHAAWEAAKAMIRDPSYRHGAAGRAEHRAALRLSAGGGGGGLPARREAGGHHVIVTGRNAKDELIEIADLVTEMTQIKHPFRDGVKAQAGIEF